MRACSPITTTTTTMPTLRAVADSRDAALEILLDPSLEPIVEVVVAGDGDRYDAMAVDGRVSFRRERSDSGWSFEVEHVEGRNPLGDQATDRFVGLEAERAGRHPTRTTNAYPYAYEQVAQLFDHPAAPDLCVVHSAAHNWEDQGGHRGEHGSLDAVQARAPFVIAGAGVRAMGRVPRACRLIDVAPTVAQLLGVAPEDGSFLRCQDGEAHADLIDDRDARPDHLVGFLLDGTNPNVLYAMADAGEAPNVARLMAMGTTFEHGAVAALPTVTLANHTSVLTGAYPGHHGILHNAWYDRRTGEQVITNSPTTWPGAMAWLAPGVETLHHAVRRTWPDAFTASINEPCDAGASFSTFDLIRAGEAVDRPPQEPPGSTERFVRPVKEYRWGSRVDHTGVEQAVGILSGHWRGTEWPLPRFLWANFTLTDSAFHEGGPDSDIARASVRDTDARIGRILEAVEHAGIFDRTAFFLVADHGMEETDPGTTGDWDVVLRDAGLDFRDEAYGFLYFDT
jgi:phosphonoacetate hydrolase